VIYIFDIDGTIADLSHRLHYIKEKPAKWKEFFANCGADTPILDVIQLMRYIVNHAQDRKIMLVSGRSDECEEETINWLYKYDVPFTSLYMRRAGDHREDSVVKAELLQELIEDWKEALPIAGVFEDRQQVVDMYRSKGLRAYQVAPGNF